MFKFKYKYLMFNIRKKIYVIINKETKFVIIINREVLYINISIKNLFGI